MIELRRILAFVGMIVIVAAFVSRDRSPAERHLRLLKSEPAADALLDAPPNSVELWFSEAPEVKVTTIQLTAAGATRKLQKVAADPEE
jgi:methionine-rich copper-binding protein CopC